MESGNFPGAAYKWLSYSQVQAAAIQFGSGLLALGAKQRRGSGEPHKGRSMRNLEKKDFPFSFYMRKINIHRCKYSFAFSPYDIFAFRLIFLLDDDQELLGIYSQNTKEWLIAAQGAWSYSMCVVPLYDTLGPQVHLLLNLAVSPLLLVSSGNCVS